MTHDDEHNDTHNETHTMTRAMTHTCNDIHNGFDLIQKHLVPY